MNRLQFIHFVVTMFMFLIGLTLGFLLGGLVVVRHIKGLVFKAKNAAEFIVLVMDALTGGQFSKDLVAGKDNLPALKG